jgi:sugar/nucleoside kinase (ribokinase family)
MLLVGHVCQDQTPDGPRLGGTVTFSALTAQALGLKAGIVTSAPDNVLPLLAPLASIPLRRIASAQPTTFTNHYTAQGRQQTLSGRASPLGWEDIPLEWRSTALVHLAPVADEIDPDIVTQLKDTFVGLTPQGWMRGWDESGRVFFKGWNRFEDVLRHGSAAVLSIEDIQADEALAQQMADQCRVTVVTRGAEGCSLFIDGSPQLIPAIQAAEIDPTGAGDIFAVAFFWRLSVTGDPPAAARFASILAGHSVTRSGLHSIPTRREVKAALRAS